ncbi:MAG: transposase [Aquirhabdus sp.]
MTAYRRNKTAGASYFFTVNLWNRSTSLLIDHIDVLREAHQYVMRRHPFQLEAMVVLPDHLHALWTLPFDDDNYPMRWRLFKSYFSRNISNLDYEQISKSRQSKSERGIWQRRYWEHLILDEKDFEQHITYIHFNPVKHGHVTNVKDWPYSTFHRYVQEGKSPLNWGSEINEGRFGE